MSEAKNTTELVQDVVDAAVRKGRDRERERAVRLYDHHVAGRVVDDDTARALDAFVKDLRSGAEPWK